MSRNLEARIIRLENVRTASGLAGLTEHELDVSIAVLWERARDEEVDAQTAASGFDPEQERDMSPAVVLPVLRKLRSMRSRSEPTAMYDNLIAVYSTAPEGVRKLRADEAPGSLA